MGYFFKKTIVMGGSNNGYQQEQKHLPPAQCQAQPSQLLQALFLSGAIVVVTYPTHVTCATPCPTLFKSSGGRASQTMHACICMACLPCAARVTKHAHNMRWSRRGRVASRRDVVPTTGAKQSRIRGCFNAGYKVLAYHVAYYISYHMGCSDTIRQ